MEKPIWPIDLELNALASRVSELHTLYTSAKIQLEVAIPYHLEKVAAYIEANFDYHRWLREQGKIEINGEIINIPPPVIT